MSFVAKLQRARELLEQLGRLSLRALRRELEVDDEELDELIEELVQVQRVARREENVLVWAAASTPKTGVEVSRTASRVEQPETRKVISVIFADLMGSTALQERLDPESVNRVMDAYYQAVRGPVEATDGTVVQLLGDGVLCAFGIPQIAEDDALRAVRAGVGIQQAFREFLQAQRWLTLPIGLRVAVNTGEVVVSHEHPAGIGDPLNVAARLQQEARDGEVLIGPATRRLVAHAVTLEPAGVFALKGRAEPVRAYRVVSLEPPAGIIAAPFVGRDEELRRIRVVYETAVAKPAARLTVVLGSPGLGKSRLIDEFARCLGDDATVLAAHCDAEGGATFAPLAEALRQWASTDGESRSGATVPADATRGAAGTTERVPPAALEAIVPKTDPERARIINGIAALLAGSPASPEETFFVIRRFLTAVARNRPVILVIDDLHWAEPLLLDLVEHLVQWGSGVPLLVLVGARPELRDLRSSLVTPGGLVSDVVTLGGLDAGAAMRLAANVIGATDLPAAVAAKVLATSEGNPLFVGELVRMLVDEGAIERQGDRWIIGANLATLEMPPTIQALLAARIERLRPEERTVLERAAVVGRHFSRSAVAELLSQEGADLDARLEALQRRELIERDTGWFLGEPVRRFHHVLIRDAAYRRLLKGTRVELHERLANWIEKKAGDNAEHDETIGWHLEQAHQHLRELGPLDAKGQDLGERAAQRLAAAGRRALARDDVPVAADLLGRAIERLDAEAPARADLALDWCEALLSAGDVAAAAKAIDELGSGIGGRGSGAGSHPNPQPLTPNPRLQAWHTCFAGQLTALTAPEKLQAAADAVAAAADELAKVGDAAGEAKAHSVHAQALARLGRVGACEAALDRALAAARKAGDRRRANAVLAGAPLAALWGPSPVTRASGRCLDVVRVLRITQGAPAVESVALSCQGVLEALRGRTDAARRMIASSRKMVEELGIAHRLFEADVFAGRIDLLEGDAPSAERTLRAAYEGLRDLGLGIDAARAGAMLARALLAQDRIEEAEALSHESERLAGDDLQAAIAWRGARAEALARRGETKAAVELAQAAVAIASATDALLDHADARIALASALRAAHRGTEADGDERRAIELWEAKGATLLVERARRGEPRRASQLLDDTPFGFPLPLGEGQGEGSKDETARWNHPHPSPLPGGEGAEQGRRRVRPNTASAAAERLQSAALARDMDAIAVLCADDLQVLHHPLGTVIDREGGLQRFRILARTEGLRVSTEPLATLGDSLLLSRDATAFDAFSENELQFGASETRQLTLFQTNANGQVARVEVLAEDRLGDALGRLYERYAELLPEGPERERAAATARSFGVMLTSPADDRIATVIAPDFESVDHRQLSTWSMRSGGAFLEHLRALREVANDITIGTHDVLALGPEALLIQRMHSGTERLGGGAYERPFLVLFANDASGRLARAEWFADDHESEALARFDELTANVRHAGNLRTLPPRRRGASVQEGGVDSRQKIAGMTERTPSVSPLGKGRTEEGSSSEPFDNAASRADRRLFDCFNARDWAGVEALAAPELVFDERRRMLHNTCGRDVWLEQFRVLYDVPASRFTTKLLATRGERLALSLHCFAGEVAGGGGPLAMDDHFVLHEVDRDGRIVAIVLFDEVVADAAYAELDARWEAGEAMRHPRASRWMRNFAATRERPDPDAIAALFAPTLVARDHRLVGWGTLHGPAAFLDTLRALSDLAPDVQFRADHVRMSNRGVLTEGVWVGTREGGAFESPLVTVVEVDAHGKALHLDLYDPHHVDRALLRFAELNPALSPLAKGRMEEGSPSRTAQRPAALGKPTTATAAMERMWIAFGAQDLDAARALCAPGFVWEDRRPIVGLSGDIELMIASARERLATGARHERRSIVGTAGDRIVTARVLWAGGPPGGRFEVEFFSVNEVDEAGLFTAMIFLDPDDERAAQREAWTRWAAIDPVAAPWVELLTEITDAWNSHDRARVRACFADDFVIEDHRHAGLGRIEGANAYVNSNVVLWELAPDQRLEVGWSWPAVDRHSLVVTQRRVGTLVDGGAFESEYVWLGLARGGRFTRVELFEIDDLDKALARFEELRPED